MQQVDQNENGEFMMDVISIFYTGGDDEVQKKDRAYGQAMPETMRNDEGNRIRIFLNQLSEFAKEMGWYNNDN